MAAAAFLQQESVVECVQHAINTEPDDMWPDAELQTLAAKLEHDWLGGVSLA